jgi:hypothetical protein
MCQFKNPWWIPKPRLYDNLRDINVKIEYFPVKLCNLCNRVWEEPLKFSEVRRNGNKIIFHDDFPTYKLERKVCYACIEEKRDKIYSSRRKKSK